jgi:hypothetical protein
MKEKDSESKIKDDKTDNTFIFSNENVNIGRQPEFDYLKTLAIIIMIASHLNVGYSYCYIYKTLEDVEALISAATYMFLMGMGMKYSRHHEIKHFVSRGITLLTLAQFFNFLRDTLPNLIAFWRTGDKVFISRALLIIRGDILTFAGYSHLFLALLKKIKLSDIHILIISIIMNLIVYPLSMIMKSPNNFLLSQFLGYFIFTNAESYFPLCGHFVFVAFGNWLGGIYQKISNKDKFYNRIFIVCFPTVIIYQYFRKNNKIPLLPEYNSYEHYCLSPGPDAIHRLMAHMMFLSIFYKIDKMLGKTPYLVKHFGKNLNQYYMLTYIIIMQSSTFLISTKGEKFTSEMKNLDLLYFAITASSWFLIEMNDKYIHFTITTLKNPIRTIVFSLIWIITIISVIYIYPKVEIYATMWNLYSYERGKIYFEQMKEQNIN